MSTQIHKNKFSKKEKLVFADADAYWAKFRKNYNLGKLQCLTERLKSRRKIEKKNIDRAQIIALISLF